MNKKTAALICAALAALLTVSCVGNVPDESSSPADVSAELSHNADPSGDINEESQVSGMTETLDGKMLVVFGDSITALGSWGKTAAESCNMRFFNGAFGGINTEEALDLIEPFVISRGPDIVTLCFGMNDLLMTAKDIPQVTPEKFAENLKTMIGLVTACGATPILMTANPLDESVFYASQGQPESWYSSVGSPLAWLDVYNQKTREVAADTGTALIDTRVLCDSSETAVTISDGIHLSAAGNNVFAAALVGYLTSNYASDPDAERVVYDESVYIPEGESVSLLSEYASAWYVPEKGTMNISVSDGVTEMNNTNGLWPDAQYTLTMPVSVNPQTGSLVCDFSTAGSSVSIILFLGGATPNAYTESQYVVISRHLGYRLDDVSLDLSPNQNVACTINLSDLPFPSGAYGEDGNLIISGVKIFVPGAAGEKVTFRSFGITG